MNIFYLSNDPKICAQYHCDSHCVKMILEYCQLLSAAHRILDGEEAYKTNSRGNSSKFWQLKDKRDGVLYQVTHENHPSTIWTCSTSGNYIWLYKLLIELGKEYEFRYGRIHKSFSDGIVEMLGFLPKNLKRADFFEPTQAMPDKYKTPNDAIAAYRAFYLSEKTKLLRWKNRETPDWVSK